MLTEIVQFELKQAVTNTNIKQGHGHGQQSEPSCLVDKKLSLGAKEEPGDIRIFVFLHRQILSRVRGKDLVLAVRGVGSHLVQSGLGVLQTNLIFVLQDIFTESLSVVKRGKSLFIPDQV